MDDEKICLGSIAVVILMFAVLAGMTWYDDYKADKKRDEAKDEALIIQEGDEVSVDYIGRFIGSSGEPGPVFDTTLPEIARNSSIPKSTSFAEKPTYDDLTFKVGSGQMIAGFDTAVIGKKVGQTFTVSIPPEKAYGAKKEELIFRLNATQTLDMVEEVTPEDFSKVFPQVSYKNITSFIHPYWGWEVKVLSYTEETVTLMHQPVYGKRYGRLPWNSTVTDVSTQRNIITIQHSPAGDISKIRVPFFALEKLDPVWTLKAVESSKEQPPAEGFVTSAGGVLTIDFNKEVSGKTLLFQITINNVKRS